MNTLDQMKQRLKKRFLGYLSTLTMPQKAEPTQGNNVPPKATGNKTREMRKLKHGKTYHTESGLKAAKANTPA